jgi:predicted transcriptional regulator
MQDDPILQPEEWTALELACAAEVHRHYAVPWPQGSILDLMGYAHKDQGTVVPTMKGREALALRRKRLQHRVRESAGGTRPVYSRRDACMVLRLVAEGNWPSGEFYTSDLCEHHDLPWEQAAALVEDLVARGLLERRSSAGVQFYYCLTPKGRAYHGRWCPR